MTNHFAINNFHHTNHSNSSNEFHKTTTSSFNTNKQRNTNHSNKNNAFKFSPIKNKSDYTKQLLKFCKHAADAGALSIVLAAFKLIGTIEGYIPNIKHSQAKDKDLIKVNHLKDDDIDALIARLTSIPANSTC